MEIISTIILVAGLLVFIVGLVGIFYPAWLDGSKASGASRVSRIDCAILASLGPLPFMFVADWFRTADKPEGLFGFLMANSLLIGLFAFYFWGLSGVRNYLYREKGMSLILAILCACVLAVIPVLGFGGVFFSMIATNTPKATFKGQVSAFFVGAFILLRFKDAFRLSLLGALSASFGKTATVLGSGGGHQATPEGGTDASGANGWLFSFTYTEDDGLPVRGDALISSAASDDQGRRYIQGICTKTSTPRFFWLGRILGPMAGPVTEASNGEAWEASAVFEQLLLMQSQHAEA